MHPRRSGRTPSDLVMLVLAITVVPLATLVWLGARVLDQERTLQQQQATQQVRNASDVVVAALQGAVSATEQRLAAGASDWPKGAVAASFQAGSVQVAPRDALAFYPVIEPLREAPASAFDAADQAEFWNQDPKSAADVLNSLSRSPEMSVRATAAFRLAGLYQRQGRTTDALREYATLTAVDDVAVGGAPIGLLARYARCAIFHGRGESATLTRETEALAADLRSGRWQLVESQYRLYARDAATWLNAQPEVPDDRELLAAAVQTLSAQKASWPADAGAPPKREILTIAGKQLTVLKQTVGGSPRAFVATPAFVEAEWLSTAVALATERGVSFSITGTPGGSDVSSEMRLATSTGLPWTVSVSSTSPAGDVAQFTRRRTLLLSGLAVLIGLALIAGYVIVRAVSREMAVARLQSDFVAAVSHEFRTPLTSLRQFTDMLRDGTARDEDRRRICYEAQARATDRLTRLVESVLDFGRMEADARPYHFEPHDCAELVGGVVEEFQREVGAGCSVVFRRDASAEIETDREALSRAVWNLLDNAVKYSPGRRTIEVALGRRPDGVSIAVRDYGIGVPAVERQAIFDRFTRGGEAIVRGIKGTGIGLAMVDQIVKAHRGRIEVESEVGKGSTFTVILPTRA